MTLPDSRRWEVALLFSEPPQLPPEEDDVKAYYVSKEFLGRGVGVSWFHGGPHGRSGQHEGLRLESLSGSHFGQFAFLPRLLAFCRVRGIKCVYIDEWLFLRHRPLRRLPIIFGLRAFGIRVVLDQRDPYMEYQITLGKLRVGSRKHRLLNVAYSLTYQLVDLIVLPSLEYSKHLARRGVSKRKIIGVFRGVDPELFTPNAKPASLRIDMNLDGRFVVGWVGHISAYRLIEEVMIPLIGEIKSIIPNCTVLIGGAGPLLDKFVSFRNDHPEAPLELLGRIPHNDVPGVLACCDVLLSPLDSDLLNTRFSLPLKVAEAVAVGKPIIATRTQATEEWREMGGVVWVGKELDDFAESLKTVYANYNLYARMAREQSMNFEKYTTKHTISSIVESIVRIVRGREPASV